MQKPEDCPIEIEKSSNCLKIKVPQTGFNNIQIGIASMLIIDIPFAPFRISNASSLHHWWELLGAIMVFIGILYFYTKLFIGWARSSLITIDLENKIILIEYNLFGIKWSCKKSFSEITDINVQLGEDREYSVLNFFNQGEELQLTEFGALLKFIVGDAYFSPRERFYRCRFISVDFCSPEDNFLNKLNRFQTCDIQSIATQAEIDWLGDEINSILQLENLGMKLNVADISKDISGIDITYE